MIVIAIGPDAKRGKYRKVLDKIAGKEVFFVEDYNELQDVVDDITALICRKYQ